MLRIPDGGCIVSAGELVDAPYTSQLTYHILRARGAPIIGLSVLLLDPAYKWFVHRADADSEEGTLLYEWEYIG